ncbi:hypothetical protein [Chitinophaga arvensicola]|uniref:hypothetical protein n=1 Tax=Chitinophaga arvensicola TaxID=29529 RepID=UPI00115F9896|nr:hypothetical protein [Chitinophaga arvensicola]
MDNICVVSLTGNNNLSYVFIHEQRWQLLDSVDDWLDFRLEDANGDHIPDVMASGHPDIHGMGSSYIYLHHADSFVRVSMPGRVCAAKYDSASQVLRSYYVSGARGVHNKEEYRWKDDHLFLFRGVEMDMTRETEIITTWYHAVGNTIVNDRRRRDGESYDTAFWPLYNP